jgi:hypothetical protein
LPAPEPGIEGDTDGPTPGDVLSSPAGTLRLEEWVTPTARPPKRTHADARRYCETLGQTAHLGIHGWQLANPAMATKLADTAGVPAGRYWTSARHKGRALVVDIPRGSKDSINAERRSARPLCIARWP